jgi:hypothetical protein
LGERHRDRGVVGPDLREGWPSGPERRVEQVEGARAEVAGAGERVVCREAALTEEGGVGQLAPELRERWDRSH